ncbi:hypothetical protein QYF36_019324 [Acer negundo]|nr:hypothetical protein QYF36_019324 [Acer negundo]
MQEFSKLFGAFNIADFIPWLGWVHANEFNRRLARARESLDGFIDTIIDNHLAKKIGNTEGKLDGDVADTDMVDKLMAFYSEEDDVVFGGTETVASAIECAMSELMKRPEDLKKVQQELSDKVGLTRFVHESDLENLAYLKCAIKETLRLHPPIPLLLHETAEDSVVSGELDMEDMFGLTAPRAVQLVAVLSYRLSCHLNV